MGVPMIIPAMFFMAVALGPIVLIESSYIAKRLGIHLQRTVGPVALANVITTLVGIPSTWVVLFVLQLITGAAFGQRIDGFGGKLISVTLQSAWMFPYPDETAYWVFYLSALFLLIPFFFATWLVEYVVMRNKLASEVVNTNEAVEISTAERTVFRTVRNANLLSYGLIALLIVVSLILVALNRT